MSISKPENVTKVIHIKENQYFTEALKDAGYDNIPSNVILDKTLTGIGATYTEIESKRNSIIIEPNVPVIVGKTKGRSEILGVYEKCTPSKIKKYFLNDIQPKKFITTPESFRKIKDVAIELDIDIYKDYFCLFDECEKIMQDGDYRENITDPICDFFQFDQKAFVSATPLTIKHPDLKLQDFERIKIVPDFNYIEDIEIIGTDKFYPAVLERLKHFIDSPCVCIFFNSTAGINKIITSLKLMNNEYKIFCSDKSKMKLKELEFINTYEELNLPLTKYNFFTSRFYSAVDIELPYKPDIVILTNLYTVRHSMVDPYSEVIQIQGRFRKKHGGKRYNSLTHITNFLDMNALTDEQVMEEFEEWKITYLSLTERYRNATRKIAKESITKEINTCSLFPYLYKPDYKVNDFKVINKYNEERIKNYYSNEKKLMQAYSDTGWFNPRYINDIDSQFSFDVVIQDILFGSKKSKNEKVNIRLFIDYLKTCGDIEQLRKQFTGSLKDVEKNDFYCTLIDAFKEFGSIYFDKDKFFSTIKKDLTKALKYKEGQKKLICKEFIQAIIEEFKPVIGKHVLQKEAKDRLQICFNRYGVIKKDGTNYKVKPKNIKDYFNIKRSNGGKDSQTFHFVAVLPEIEKIALN